MKKATLMPSLMQKDDWKIFLVLKADWIMKTRKNFPLYASLPTPPSSASSSPCRINFISINLYSIGNASPNRRAKEQKTLLCPQCDLDFDFLKIAFKKMLQKVRGKKFLKKKYMDFCLHNIHLKKL